MKAAKVSGHLLLRESSDEFVSSCNRTLKSGFWNVAEAVFTAECRLEFQKLLGYHQTNRAGFGSFHQPETPAKHSHAYRKLVSSVLVEEDDEVFRSKAVQLHLQGYWMRWCDFMKNDLSWKTLLGMPSSLLSFCLNTTYGTLPSPSNLKRWQITTESSCFLCQKIVCTTAHILGACQIALKQQRFTYRHDTVLSVSVSTLVKFLSSYVASPNSSSGISFVKEGQKPKNARKPTVGLLHSAPKWKILYDFQGSPTVPSFLTVTTLRPDIVLYSCSIKAVIIIELTCPCEENMPYWHDKKRENYHSLCTSIKANGWTVSLFAVEVGAIGYAAESLLSCLRCLGFPSKLCRSTIKNISTTCLKCSFDIWMARNCSSWKLEGPCKSPSDVSSGPATTSASSKSIHLSTSKTASFPPETRKVDHPKTVKASQNKVNVNHFHCGLFNKGNTCYVNVILQALRPLSSLWSDSSTPSQTSSALGLAFRRLMANMGCAKTCIDPSPFLFTLENFIRRSGRSSFVVNSKQDAAEVLEHVLNELMGDSVVAGSTTAIKNRISISCNSCFNSLQTEDICFILQLTVCSDIQTSLNSIFISECLQGENAPFCHLCASKQDAESQFSICEVGCYVIVQLKRFFMIDGVATKNAAPVACSPYLSVPVRVDDEVTGSRNFSLVSGICHSDTLTSGHYSAFVRDNVCGVWLHYNDKAVTRTTLEAVNGPLPYILFYKAC